MYDYLSGRYGVRFEEEQKLEQQEFEQES